MNKANRCANNIIGYVDDLFAVCQEKQDLMDEMEKEIENLREEIEALEEERHK